MDHHHLNSSVHEPKDHEVLEAGELFEDSWFFSNLLERKPRMLRSFSDPYTSLNYNNSPENFPSYEETYESIKKLSVNDGFTRSNLTKAPSMPPTKGKDIGRGKSSNRRRSSEKLNRAPSLPTSLGTEEIQDEEIEFSLGKLIRQASMNCSDTLPPRTNVSKGLSPSSSISRHKSRRKPELESIKSKSFDEKTPQLPINHLKTQKSLSFLESEELQGFKDLGFDFDKNDLSPNVVNMVPGLQEKKKPEENKEKNTRRPYLSEAWMATSSAPPVPRWGGKRSTEDMKAQIKFWARAVASNVRQEC